MQRLNQATKNLLLKRKLHKIKLKPSSMSLNKTKKKPEIEHLHNKKLIDNNLMPKSSTRAQLRRKIMKNTNPSNQIQDHWKNNKKIIQLDNLMNQIVQERDLLTRLIISLTT